MLYIYIYIYFFFFLRVKYISDVEFIWIFYILIIFKIAIGGYINKSFLSIDNLF